jgi:hypothetical protein
MPVETMARLCGILRGAGTALPVGPQGAALINLAREHRVHLVLAWRIGLTPTALEAIEGEAFAWLARQMRVEAMHDILRTRELARVLAGLVHAGLTPVVFKGAALASTDYAETWLRPRIDTDILVPPAARDVAAAALAAIGYTAPPFVSGEHVMYQRPLVRADGHGGEHVIDLHWHIANREAVAHALSHADLVEHAETVQVWGHPMQVPAPDHALLLACLHRAAHHQDAEDLLWLFDIHLLAERLTPGQWERFMALAIERAVTAVCQRGLTLAAQRFHTPLPASVLDRLTASRTTAGGEASSVFLRRNVRPIDALASDVRALGPRAGARLLWEVLFPPASYMRERWGAAAGASAGSSAGLRLGLAYVRRIAGGVGKWLRPGGADG